jgi:hypothetical protein
MHANYNSLPYQREAASGLTMPIIKGYSRASGAWLLKRKRI